MHRPIAAEGTPRTRRSIDGHLDHTDAAEAEEILRRLREVELAGADERPAVDDRRLHRPAAVAQRQPGPARQGPVGDADLVDAQRPAAAGNGAAVEPGAGP